MGGGWGGGGVPGSGSNRSMIHFFPISPAFFFSSLPNRGVGQDPARSSLLGGSRVGALRVGAGPARVAPRGSHRAGPLAEPNEPPGLGWPPALGRARPATSALWPLPAVAAGRPAPAADPARGLARGALVAALVSEPAERVRRHRVRPAADPARRQASAGPGAIIGALITIAPGRSPPRESECADCAPASTSAPSPPRSLPAPYIR